jgi:hypothetical protein
MALFYPIPHAISTTFVHSAAFFTAKTPKERFLNPYCFRWISH